MGKSRDFIFIAAIMVTVVFTFCAAASDIVIGYSGPLSGPAAEYGEDCFNGVDMAIKEINAGGGITVKGQKFVFRLEKMDDRVDPATALRNAGQMRNLHRAIAVFNPVTPTIAAMMKINQEKGNEFLIMGYSSVPLVTEMGNRLLVAHTPPFTIYVKTQADLAWSKGWRKVAIVVTAGAYGDAWRKAFREEWLKKGGEVAFDESADYYTRTDFAKPLAGALQANPDFLLIGGPSATTALLVEQAREKGFEGGFVIMEQAKLDAIAQVMRKPLLLEGAMGLAKVHDVAFPASAAFKNNYAKNYKRPLTWEIVVNYTAMYALAKAIVVAGKTDDALAIREAFPGVFPMLGDQYPTEYYGITSKGRLISPSAVQTMKHGRFTQPIVYVWWAKNKKEFDRVQKMTKVGGPLIWRDTGDL